MKVDGENRVNVTDLFSSTRDSVRLAGWEQIVALVLRTLVGALLIPIVIWIAGVCGVAELACRGMRWVRGVASEPSSLDPKPAEARGLDRLTWNRNPWAESHFLN